MKKIYFIEGIHGSGKSTLAKKIASDLRKSNTCKHIVMRSEKPCPIDICRLSYYSKNEFNAFINMISDYSHKSKKLVYEQLMQVTSYEDKYYLVNWYDYLCNINLLESDLIEYSCTHELCDGRAGIDRYKEITYRRWKKFADTISDDTIYLFEGALLQHPITELLGYYLTNDTEIIRFINDLLCFVSDITLEIDYINVDNVSQILTNAAQERKKECFSWIDGFVKLTTTCKYGKYHKLSGFDGAVRFCEERIRVEKKILDQISANKVIFYRDD